MNDAVKYSLGQTVFFALDGAKKGLVTGILFRETGTTYAITWDDFNERWHSARELSAEQSFVSSEQGAK